MSFQRLVLRYGGPAVTLAAAVIGSGTVIIEARSGRAHVLNMTDSKFEAVQSQITELQMDTQNIKEDIKTDIQDLGAEVQDLGAEMQTTQSMILETSLHTMQAIDGNKAPLRKWIERIERCRKNGGDDCGPIRKE